MRCMNCGLPLSPERSMTNCPRCGVSLNVLQGVQQQQFEQAGWGNMGGAPQQNQWGSAPGAQSSFLQPGQQSQADLNPARTGGFNGGIGSGMYPSSPLLPRRPYPPPKSKTTPRLLFIVAGFCILLSALMLGFVALIGFSGSGSPSQNTASTSANTATASSSNSTTPQAVASPTAAHTSTTPTPAVSASPSVTGTAYPGQQYIDGAQMAQGVNPKTSQPQQLTTTFKVGSNMYITFNIHPPTQGGAVCSYWYLNGKQVTSYPFPIKGTSRSSYAYATYSNTGQAYVELYWASNTSCSDQVLAQHLDFTVTS